MKPDMVNPSRFIRSLSALAIALAVSGCAPSLETPDDWFEQGMAQVQRGDGKSAIASFDKSIALGNPDAAVYVNRGLLRDEQGRYADAIADYTTAIKISPELDEAYYNRGNSHHQRGDLEASVADYSKAIEIRPDYVYAYANRAMSYEQRDEIDKALADLGKAQSLFQAENDTANADRVKQEIARLKAP